MEKGWAEQFVTATVDAALIWPSMFCWPPNRWGLGGVFIGGIRNDPQTVCDLLGIPDQAYPGIWHVPGLAVSRPTPQTPPARRGRAFHRPLSRYA